MFNRTGILCGHGLKVLDLMNIKTLPTHYILKRWTREACNGSIQDRQGRNVIENPKLEAQLRYKDLSHKFHNMAHKVANSRECGVLLESALDSVAPRIDDLLNAATSAMSEPYKDKENVDPKVQQIDELLSSARLKKKEVHSSNLRRKKTWLDKLHKGKRKPTKATAPTKKGEKQQNKKVGVQQKKKGGVQPQVQVKKYENSKGANLDLQESNGIISFSQLLTGPPCDDDYLF